MRTHLLKALTGLCLALTTLPVFATANYVYHERTVNDPGCGGQYVTTLTPNSSQPHPLRWKIEYQFYTDTTRVYYTTDGSAPSGAFGVPSGATQVINGTYVCTFGGPLVDVASASIPAQPAGTTVKYIISAWHTGGGPEIFANSGEFISPFTTSSAATVFQYTVSSTPEASALVESRTSGGTATANPPYAETGTWSTSGSKSTVQGGLVGSGSRFATNGTPAFTVTPTLTVGVTYLVQSTLTASTASADLVAAISTSGLSASTLPATTTAFQTSRGNLWTSLGTITPSSATPTITFTYSSGTLNTSAARVYADSVRFIPVSVAGAKTWNGGAANDFWNSGLNWGGTGLNPGGGDAAIFAGTVRTNPVMDGPFSVTSVTFNPTAGGFFVGASGGSLTVGTAGVTNSSANDQLISAPIAQSGTALNVNTGSSTNQVTLNGLLTGTGGYNAIGTGTLYVSNAANTITGPVSVSGGATLRLPASSSIGGTGVGSGNVTLDNGTYRNDDVSAAGNLLTANRSILIGAGGGTIRVPSGSQILLSSNTISGPGNTLTYTGSGELRVLTNVNSLTGGRLNVAKLVIDTGIFTIGQGTSAGTEETLGAIPGSVMDDAITLRNGGRLRNNVAALTLNANRGITLGTGGGVLRAVNSAANLTIPSAIKGANPLTIGGGTDTGTIFLSNTGNTFGNVSITGGSGTRLALGASGVIPDTSVVTISSSGCQFDLNGFDETVKSIAGGAGTFVLGAKTLMVTNPAGESYSSVFTSTSAGKFVKGGSGALSLSGSSTGFLGEFLINDGTIGIGGSQSLGTNNTVTFNGGKLANTGSGTRTIPALVAVNLNADLTVDDSLFTPNPGTFNFTGPTTLRNGDRTLTVANTASVTFSGPIGEDAAGRKLVKTGAGNLTLTGTNTFSGNFTNLAGSVSIGATGPAPFGSGAGTLVLAGGNIIVTSDRSTTANNLLNPVQLTANTELQAPTTTGTRNLVFGGPLSGSAGTLTIRNTQVGVGPASFNVRVTNSFTFDRPIAGAVDTVGNSVQFDIWNRSDLGEQTYNGIISGPLIVRRSITTANTGGKVTFNAANTYSGGTLLNDGEIGLGSDCAGLADAPTSGPLGTGTITIGNDAGKLSASGAARNLKNRILFSSSGRNLTFLGANPLELSGTVDLAGLTNTFIASNTGDALISGALTNGGMTKSGTGLLILSGANVHTGPTTVSTGTLRVNGSIPGGSSVTVTGGTLEGVGTLNGPVNVQSAGTLAPGPNIDTLTLGSTLTLAGTTAVQLDKSAGQTSDKLLGISTLTAGGALQVANTGPALVPGDSFPVFGATTYAGAFASVSPAPGAGLAWDTERLRTNGVLLVHNIPVAGDDAASVAQGQTTTIPVFKLLANDSDADGDTLSITAVSANASLGGGLVTYTAPLSGSSDTITYTLSDGRGGTATGTINVTLTAGNGQGFNQLALPENISGNTWRLSYLGIPGTNYALDWRTNLSLGPWMPVATNPAGPTGQLLFTNTSSEPENYYRTRYVP